MFRVCRQVSDPIEGITKDSCCLPQKDPWVANKPSFNRLRVEQSEKFSAHPVRNYLAELKADSRKSLTSLWSSVNALDALNSFLSGASHTGHILVEMKIR